MRILLAGQTHADDLLQGLAWLGWLPFIYQVALGARILRLYQRSMPFSLGASEPWQFAEVCGQAWGPSTSGLTILKTVSVMG